MSYPSLYRQERAGMSRKRTAEMADLRYGLKSYQGKQRKVYAGQTASQAARALVAMAPGLVRTGGNYGRYGYSAARVGLKPELKFFDTALSFNFDVTGEVPASGQLALIPQGDTESTRDGRLAVIKSIQIRGVATFSPGAAANAQTQNFLYLILDTQANGAAAAITDIFTSNLLSTAMLNLNNSGRFRILKRWNLGFQAQAGVSTAYNDMSKQIEFYKRCNIKMDWSSTTGAITEVRSNNIFLAAGCSSGFDDNTAFVGTCRLRFVG